jgi:hypothetical protein
VPAQDSVLYPIVRQLKTGFIDRQGHVVIEPQFDLMALTDRLSALFSEEPEV